MWSNTREATSGLVDRLSLGGQPAAANFRGAGDTSKAHPLRSWRRRIAAMRVFHVLALGSTAIGSILTLTGSVRDSGPYGGGEMGAALLLLATMGITCFRLWGTSRYCDRAPVDAPSLAHAEITERLRSLAGVPNIPVFFQPLPKKDHAPARVAKTRRGLHILLSPSNLEALRGTHPGPLVSGIIWHEIGHFFQWDTTLGRWTLRASRLMGWLSLFISFIATLYMICIVVIFVRSAKLTALPIEIVAAFLVTFLATACMFAVFLGVRYWCRFSEYNSDQTAVIAGYGPETVQFLKSDRPTRISSFLGFHPSNAKRIDRIGRLLAEAHGHQSGLSASEPLAGPGGLKIPPSDYLYGGLLYVAPIFLAFELGTRMLILVAHHLLPGVGK